MNDPILILAQLIIYEGLLQKKELYMCCVVVCCGHKGNEGEGLIKRVKN